MRAGRGGARRFRSGVNDTIVTRQEMEQQTMAAGGVMHSYLKLLVHVNENMHLGCVCVCCVCKVVVVVVLGIGGVGWG